MRLVGTCERFFPHKERGVHIFRSIRQKMMMGNRYIEGILQNIKRGDAAKEPSWWWLLRENVRFRVCKEKRVQYVNYHGLQHSSANVNESRMIPRPFSLALLCDKYDIIVIDGLSTLFLPLFDDVSFLSLQEKDSACEINVYMQRIVNALLCRGHKVFVVFDAAVMNRKAAQKLCNTYVKGVVCCCANTGIERFEEVKQTAGENKTIAGLCDTFSVTLEQMSKTFDRLFVYESVHACGWVYRPPLKNEKQRSFFAALIDNHLYGGAREYDRAYEMGYTQAGVLAMAYALWGGKQRSEEGLLRTILYASAESFWADAFRFFVPEQKLQTMCPIACLTQMSPGKATEEERKALRVAVFTQLQMDRPESIVLYYPGINEEEGRRLSSWFAAWGCDVKLLLLCANRGCAFAKVRDMMSGGKEQKAKAYFARLNTTGGLPIQTYTPEKQWVFARAEEGAEQAKSIRRGANDFFVRYERVCHQLDIAFSWDAREACYPFRMQIEKEGA